MINFNNQMSNTMTRQFRGLARFPEYAAVAALLAGLFAAAFAAENPNLAPQAEITASAADDAATKVADGLVPAVGSRSTTLAALALATTLARGDEPKTDQVPSFAVPRMATAPTIDGVLAPGEWDGAAQLPA